MEKIISEFRSYLQSLIEAEQQRQGFDMPAMLHFMQAQVSLPDWYRVPAQQNVDARCAQAGQEKPDAGLREVLQEAIKAVYGAWIRERFRSV